MWIYSLAKDMIWWVDLLVQEVKSAILSSFIPAEMFDSQQKLKV